MFGHIVQFGHVLGVFAATAPPHKDHSAATWIIPVVLLLVMFMFMRRQGIRRQGPSGPGGPGRFGRPPADPQRLPRSARQAMRAPASAWDSDTESDTGTERSSDA